MLYLEVEESQDNSQQYCPALSSETTTTQKVTANHSYTPAGFFKFILFCLSFDTALGHV